MARLKAPFLTYRNPLFCCCMSKFIESVNPLLAGVDQIDAIVNDHGNQARRGVDDLAQISDDRYCDYRAKQGADAECMQEFGDQYNDIQRQQHHDAKVNRNHKGKQDKDHELQQSYQRNINIFHDVYFSMKFYIDLQVKPAFELEILPAL